MFQEQSPDHRKMHHREPKSWRKWENEYKGCRNLCFQFGINCFQIIRGIKTTMLSLTAPLPSQNSAGSVQDFLEGLPDLKQVSKPFSSCDHNRWTHSTHHHITLTLIISNITINILEQTTAPQKEGLLEVWKENQLSTVFRKKDCKTWGTVHSFEPSLLLNHPHLKRVCVHLASPGPQWVYWPPLGT